MITVHLTFLFIIQGREWIQHSTSKSFPSCRKHQEGNKKSNWSLHSLQWTMLEKTVCRRLSTYLPPTWQTIKSCKTSTSPLQIWTPRGLARSWCTVWRLEGFRKRESTSLFFKHLFWNNGVVPNEFPNCFFTSWKSSTSNNTTMCK